MSVAPGSSSLVDRLTVARKLHALGFSLIPVNGKLPAVKWEAFQVARPTDDNLLSWFGNGTDRNIGVVTGAVSGIVVVDTDSPEAEAWAQAHLPATPMRVQTSKGVHRYYRHPGGQVGNRARVTTTAGELELDIRGDGGFVVGPGSIHPDGPTYRAPEPWPSTLNDVPVFSSTWFGTTNADRRSDTIISSDAVIPEGRRNVEMASMAGSMRRRGMSEAAIVAALKAENERRCQPPLSDVEIEAIAASVSRYQPEPPKSHTIRVRRRIALLNDAELMNRPDPAFLVDGHLVRQTLAPAYGPPESYKSFLFTVDLALSIATGRAWLGSPVSAPGATVAVVAEGGDALKQRIRAWKVSRGYSLEESVGFHILPQPLDLSEPDEVQQFIDAVGPLNPRLVVLDTLPRCLGVFEENSNSEMGRAIEALDRIKTDIGAVVMPITHSDKQVKDVRGASALRGAADTLFRVTREDDLCIVTCDKQKDAAPFPDLRVKIVPVPDTGSVVPRLYHEVLPASQLTVKQFKVWSTLFELVKEKGATSTELERLCPDINPRTLYRVLLRLTELGAVYQESNGKRYFARPIGLEMYPDAGVRDQV